MERSSGKCRLKGTATAISGPASSSLELAAPIDRWDEAVPLGNGLMGGLLWGGGNVLRLSLDRGDLWDLRVPKSLMAGGLTWAKMRDLVSEGNQARISELVDEPFHLPNPTKLPAGRLTLTLPSPRQVQGFSLDLSTAVATAKLSGGTLQAFYSAREPVAMMRLVGAQAEPKLTAPESVAKLGYPPAAPGHDHRASWFVQEGADGLSYVVLVASRRKGAATELALAITSTRDGGDPLALARRRVSAALATGYDRLLAGHVRWWRRFWSASGLRVPDAAVQQHYDLAQYFYGAASRRGAPPMPLQGVWTADEGDLPPWKGDYHNDLNTQLTYWACFPAGHLEAGQSFLDFMWRLLPAHRRFARDFYGTPGAAVPGVMSLDGKALGGWGQYSLSPTNGAWVAQSFYLHWRYTLDRKFLARRAVPYCTAIAECLQALLRPGADGKLKLPLSSSPEIHNNSLQAWLQPNSNYDLALLRWLFGALAEMQEAAGANAAARRWRNVLGRLDHLAVAKDGALMVSPAEPLRESHRHFSHLMALHPLGTLTVEGTKRDRQVIAASLAQVKRLGVGEWAGYSFSWMACICARCGLSEEAAGYLRTYLQAFVSRNGFHLNGDYRKQLPQVRRTYRPFTLEGNFAAAQAVHELLLQSWGGVVRVFPAVPAAWKEVAFTDLRAEGAWLVSAERADGRTLRVRIRAEHGGHLRLRNPFGRRKPRWNCQDVAKVGDNYECDLAAGEFLEGGIVAGKPAGYE